MEGSVYYLSFIPSQLSNKPSNFPNNLFEYYHTIYLNIINLNHTLYQILLKLLTSSKSQHNLNLPRTSRFPSARRECKWSPLKRFLLPNSPTPKLPHLEFFPTSVRSVVDRLISLEQASSDRFSSSEETSLRTRLINDDRLLARAPVNKDCLGSEQGRDESFRGLGRVAGTGWQSARIDRSNFVRAWNKGVVEPIADPLRPRAISRTASYSDRTAISACNWNGGRGQWRRADGSAPRFRPPPSPPLAPFQSSWAAPAPIAN